MTPPRLRFFARPAFDTKSLAKSYRTLVHDADTGAFHHGGSIGHIRLENGKLFIDDVPILKPRLTADAVAWHQQIEGHHTSGHLSFEQGGAELHGVVYRGETAADADAHHVLATSIEPVEWVTRCTTARWPAGTDPSTVPAADWADGLTVAVGYTQGLGDPVPVPVVELGGQDVTSMTTWTIDPKTSQTVLLFALDPTIVCSFDDSMYLTARLSFDQLKVEPTCAGTITATCVDQGPSDASFLWSGSLAPTQPEPHGALLRSAAAPRTLTTADLQSDPSLSIAELISIAPDQSVTDEANAMITENMKWAMGQDGTERGWLNTFLGQSTPVISSDRQTLINQDLPWYQNNFAKSYLGWAFQNYAGPNAPSDKLTDADALKLKYYLQTGMAKDASFTTQQSGIYIQAFIAAKPRLQAYITDGGESWAKQLHDVITSPAQIVLMVNRVFASGGGSSAMAPANNWATLLTALEGPTGTLAGDYIQQVTAAVLNNTAHLQTWSDKDTVMEWLPAFLQQFLEQIATGGSVPDEAKIAAQQLKAMQEAMGGDIAAVAGELADFVINANGANLLQKTQNAESAFMVKWPQFQNVGKMLFFAGWCMGITMVVKAFQNWKDLSPEDRAKAVLSAIQLGFSALDVVPAFIGGVKEMGLAGWQKFTEWRAGQQAREQTIEMNEIGLEEDVNWVRNGATETTPLFDAGEGVIKTEGTVWEKIFAGAGKLLAVLGVVISAAFAVLSAIDFANDIKSGQPVSKTVLDGIMMVANIGMTVCLVLDLLVASTVFAMAAAVLAVVGLIIAIIEMFVVKPPNPLNDFMDQVAQPFVTALPAQTPPPGGSSSPASTVAYA